MLAVERVEPAVCMCVVIASDLCNLAHRQHGGRSSNFFVAAAPN